MSSGSGISLIMGGGDEAKTLWEANRVEGEVGKLLSANDRFGVAMLSSSSIVLYLYVSAGSLAGKPPVLRKSLSLVLRPEENAGGLSSKIVSIGGPLLPELLLVVVVLVGIESKASLW